MSHTSPAARIVTSRSPDGANGAKGRDRDGNRQDERHQDIGSRGGAWRSSTLTALAACSVQRPGAAEDHSLDAVEQNRAAMGVAPADSSYDQAERNRLTVGTAIDTSYNDIERLRAGRVGA